MSQTTQRVLIGLVAVIAIAVVIVAWQITRAPAPTPAQLRATQDVVMATIEAGLNP